MILSNEKINEIFFSIIWGIGISVLFRKICKNGNCVIVRIPKKNIIEEKVFLNYDTGKCYRFEKYKISC
jgi:hypothetical protein